MIHGRAKNQTRKRHKGDYQKILNFVHAYKLWVNGW
jgi:hypothetical protein